MAQLLQSSPSEALCGACLAFALNVSLEEVPTMMELLVSHSPRYGRAVQVCVRYRRTVDAIAWITV